MLFESNTFVFTPDALPTDRKGLPYSEKVSVTTNGSAIASAEFVGDANGLSVAVTGPLEITISGNGTNDGKIPISILVKTQNGGEGWITF